METSISVEKAAAKLGVHPQSLRIGLQNGEVPFGFAIKTSKSRHVYHISRKKFDEYIGGGEDE